VPLTAAYAFLWQLNRSQMILSPASTEKDYVHYWMGRTERQPEIFLTNYVKVNNYG